jgi:hypothetical protein
MRVCISYGLATVELEADGRNENCNEKYQPVSDNC